MMEISGTWISFNCTPVYRRVIKPSETYKKCLVKQIKKIIDLNSHEDHFILISRCRIDNNRNGQELRENNDNVYTVSDHHGNKSSHSRIQSCCYHKNDSVHKCQCKICTDTCFYEFQSRVITQLDISASVKQILEKNLSVMEFMDIFLTVVSDDIECVGAKSRAKNNSTQILVKRTLDPVTSFFPFFFSCTNVCYVNVFLCKFYQNLLTENENILFLTSGTIDESRGVPFAIPKSIKLKYIPEVLLIACFYIVNKPQETKSCISEAHLVTASVTVEETGLRNIIHQVFLAVLSIMAANCNFQKRINQMYELGKASQKKQSMNFLNKVIPNLSMKMVPVKLGHLSHLYLETNRELMRSKIQILLEKTLSAKNGKSALMELLFHSNFNPTGQDAFVYPVHGNDGQVSTISPAIHRNTLNPLLERYATPSPPTRRETMSYEILRLCTLHDYPIQRTPSFLRLAQAGFYFEGQGNALNCFACELKYQNWKFEDDPLEIHKTYSPACPFVNGDSSGNIPVQHAEDLVGRIAAPPRSEDPSVASGNSIVTDGAIQSGRTENVNEGGLETDLSPESRIVSATSGDNNSSTRTGSDSGIGRSSHATNQQRGAMPAATGYVANTTVAHSAYRTKSARLESFRNWPTANTQHSRDMTEAGFFYNGNGDSVRCFQCGIGLRNWDAGDNPWIEHARWSPECTYILEIKGQSFVDLVLDAAQRAEREAEERSEAAANSANGTSGDSGYSTVGQEALSGVETAAKEAPASSGDKVNIQTTRSDSSKPRQGTQSLGTTVAPKYPLQTEAAQCVIRKGYLPKTVKQAIDKLVEKKGWLAFNATNILNEVLEQKKDSGLGSSSSDSGSSGSDGNTKTKTPKTKTDITTQNQELRQLLTCKICLDESVCIAFLPCGHLVACAQCSPALRKCPICRKGIKGTVRTNLLETC